jgi:hypothetical protein
MSAVERRFDTEQPGRGRSFATETIRRHLEEPIRTVDLPPAGGDVAVDRRGQIERYGVSLPFDKQEQGSAPPRGVAIGPG